MIVVIKMKLFKKIFTAGLLLILLGLTFLFREDILRFYFKAFVYNDSHIVITGKNEYFRGNNFEFVQVTEDFSPKNRQDLLNIYYTGINSGQESFTFWCSREYLDCIAEVALLANDQVALSHINNFVHPFNSFNNIETEFDSLGRVTIRVHRTYSDDEINRINEEIDRIKDYLFSDEEFEVRDKILMVHDYIINNTRYDTNRSDYDIIDYPSERATGVFFYGMALCGGYTDAMALFLDRFDVFNFKVASENHIWNAVYLDGNWYHLDLTWNDPVTDDGSDLLLHTFFLIDTETLFSLDTDQHNFDQTVYVEVV